jgi:hypothetical protein
MPRSANAKAIGDVFSTRAALEHLSSSSPSTHLFNLCNRSRSLQAWRAFCLAKSLGTRASCTRVLASTPPSLEKEGWMRQRHLHIWFSLVKRLNLTTEESPQNVLARQPLLQ